MADDDLHRYSKEAPETEEDWQRVHRALERADKSWLVTGPQVAFVSNWKAWAFGVAMLVFLRSSEVSAIVEMLRGAE